MLNRKQTKIYVWLLKNKGYLKTSNKTILNYYPDHLVSFADIEAAKKQAQISVKEVDLSWDEFEGKAQSKVNKAFAKMIKDKERAKDSKPIIKMMSLNDIFPGIDKFKDVSSKNRALNNVAFKSLGNSRQTSGSYYITGCAHAPWQNQKMYDSVIRFLKQEIDLQGLILAGDIIDCNSLSSHDKGKKAIKGVNLGWEYKEAGKFLDMFDELEINGTKDYIYGNHEDRYNRYMSISDNSKLEEALQSPIEGLKLYDRGYNVFTDWKNDSIELGKYLDVNHGEFLNIHVAKKTIDTYKKSTLFFHTHRFQIHVEGNMGGFNMGCGVDLKAPIFGYATRAQLKGWVNSSCLVHIDKDGFYHVQPLVWMNNRLIVNGKQY